MSSDTAEFERLLDTYARLMASAIRRVCGRRNRAMIPDVEQEVRLILWKQHRRGKKIEHPASYLYKAALTTALTVLERRTPREVHVEAGQIEALARAGGREGGLAPVERARLIEQLLGRLPEEQARALRAWLAGFDHREIADLLDLTESVARHRVYRGIEALKRIAHEKG